MNVTLEKVENSEAFFEIVIEVGKFEEGLEESYKKNVKNYNIPGFRNGSAPRTIIEAKYGPEVLFQDALDLVVPDEYYAAIKELELKTFGEPDIEVRYIKKGEPISVKVRVPVKPEFTLAKLEGLEIKVPKADEVTEIDIDKYLKDLQSQNKIIIDKSKEPAALGDTVTFDYKSTIEDDSFDGQEDFKLILGSDAFFPGFEDKLVGVKKGDKLNVEITFPKEHVAAQLAGKNAQFRVTVKNVENIQLRELNDQFAQEIANVNTLQELRLEAKKKLLEMASLRYSNTEKQAVVKALTDMYEFSVPESVVMEQAQAMLEQFSNQLKSQGGTIEGYLQMINSNVQTLKKQIWEDAKNVTKSTYILDKIIQEKGFEVSDEEENSGIEAFATSLGMDKENARENLGPLLGKVLFDLKADKVAQYLLKHAVITML
ncbi:trigger factor [Desulfosporosinus fructosivorans]|uniref:Trigger factor n=1 Tax=Desulfosporosinus fructosivorans TaxID=2018669 RepID=A0A4Z0RCH8_9FIRM|nr:trigger factor [Desulfosporosinus fructosivorans]TGE39949.1 trigger factor [Desulfosporosinus fructosivorans]